MVLKAEVRGYEHEDAPELARIHDGVYQKGVVSSDHFRRRMEALLQSGGLIWVLDVERKPVGYASIRPVPGLNGIYDLQLCIGAEFQRLGLGSQLLNYLVADVKGSPVVQISCAIRTMEDPVACFLMRHGFFVEHVEFFLNIDVHERLPTTKLPPGFSLEVFSRKMTITHFRRLYDLIFAGSTWYQPYNSDKQVSADLEDATDILFLVHERKPIGFLWMRWPTLNRVEIEPLGILPAFQRQGLGSSLFQAALEQMAEQGASQATVGVWQDNASAIRFYERLGFIKDHKTIYLAYNLNSR